MPESIYDDPNDYVPDPGLHVDLFQFFANWFTDPEGYFGIEDQQYLADLLGVTLEQLPDFLANESADSAQLQAMYAYKELLDII